MQKRQKSKTAASQKPSSHATLKVFIAYDGRAAISRAKQLQFNLARGCGGDVIIDGSSWNFALLAQESLRKQAATEATSADMVIVSMSGANELPAGLQTWIKDWLARKKNTRSALVALMDPAHTDSPQHMIHQDSLKLLAEKNGVDFFCNRAKSKPSKPKTSAAKTVPEPKMLEAVSSATAWRN